MTDTHSLPNPAASIVDKIDHLVASGNLETRTGLELMIGVFRDGMLFTGRLVLDVEEIKGLLIRYTNIMDAAKGKEEANRVDIDKMKTEIETLKDTVSDWNKVVKWIAGILTLVIGAVAVGIATGSLAIQIIRP